MEGDNEKSDTNNDQLPVDSGLGINETTLTSSNGSSISEVTVVNTKKPVNRVAIQLKIAKRLLQVDVATAPQDALESVRSSANRLSTILNSYELDDAQFDEISCVWDEMCKLAQELIDRGPPSPIPHVINHNSGSSTHSLSSLSIPIPSGHQPTATTQTTTAASTCQQPSAVQQQAGVQFAANQNPPQFPVQQPNMTSAHQQTIPSAPVSSASQQPFPMHQQYPPIPPQPYYVPYRRPTSAGEVPSFSGSASDWADFKTLFYDTVLANPANSASISKNILISVVPERYKETVRCSPDCTSALIELGKSLERPEEIRLEIRKQVDRVAQLRELSSDEEWKIYKDHVTNARRKANPFGELMLERVHESLCG